MIQFRHVASRALTLLACLTASGLLYAETITLRALSDFPSTDDGAVPYYTEDERGTLAINAAIEEYRDKFARATAVYSGDGGVYDLTLNTLGELDGDCEYRVLVNGVVVGTVINDPVTVDYTEQFHTFNDITVPAGASLSVESNALSNDLIPEGDAFAFARGRWRSLTLQNDSPETTPVDLQVNTSVTVDSLQVGDSFSIKVDIENNSATETATQPVATVVIPASINVAPSSQCLVNGNDLTCALPELAAQQIQSISLDATATAQGQATVQASVSADQTDNNTGNNTSAATVNIDAAPITPATVDLQLALAVSTGDEALLIGDAVTYTLSVTNANPDNVATAPVAGVILPANLQFQSSADCTIDGINVLCSLAELAPNASATVAFVATAISAGDSTLIASVSATESEDVVSDNEIVLPVAVITTSPATPATGNTETIGGNSGGGSMSLLLMLALLVRRTMRRQDGATS